jgi:hypothetical protein
MERVKYLIYDGELIMKNMPWQDIYSIRKWETIIGYFKKGKMTTSGPSAKKSLGFFKINVKLPPMIARLDHEVRQYHKLPKQNIPALKARAGALRSIASAGALYMIKHSIPSKPETDRNIANNKKKWEANMDYAIAKLVRRARRKAGYIEKLNSLYIDGHPGFKGVSDLLKHIVATSKVPEDIDLVGMNRGIIMERIDPWHRDFEMKFADGNNVPMATQEKVFAMAFTQWIEFGRKSNLPFFIWAEGHYMCTEALDDDTYDMTQGQTGNYSALISSRGQVAYKQSDKELSADINMLWAESSQLFTYHFVVGRGFIYQVYDTTSTPLITDGVVVDKNHGRPGTVQHQAGPKNAYVWGKDKALYAAGHRTGKLHHSSFLAGDAVRCAGMIGVANGKVTWIDNDSGHYQPGTRHLHNLVSYLDRYQVFTPNAVVYDMAANKSTSVKAFLKPAIPSRVGRAKVVRRPRIPSRAGRPKIGA